MAHEHNPVCMKAHAVTASSFIAPMVRCVFVSPRQQKATAPLVRWANIAAQYIQFDTAVLHLLPYCAQIIWHSNRKMEMDNTLMYKH